MKNIGALWFNDQGGSDFYLSGYIELGILGRIRIYVYSNVAENRNAKAPHYVIKIGEQNGKATED